MLIFEPKYFLLFWTVPVLIGIFLFSRSLWEARLNTLGNPETVKNKLMPLYRPTLRTQTIYLSLVFIFAITALTRPQWGEEKKKLERKGANLVFLLDTSLSMLAEDIKPNRLEKSRLEMKSFVRHLKGDRIGMVAFAGSSFLQCPLTLDYSAFLLFLDAVTVGYIPDPGTSLAQALGVAIRSFPKEDLKHKAVIIFTDGEDHEGGMEEVMEAAKKAAVRIYTIGLGTPEGGPIPLKDEQGRKSGFKKDLSDQTVITKLNKDLLEKVAQATGGVYVPSTPSEQEVEIILKHLESLGKKQLEERSVTERDDQFQLFLMLALIFLIAEMLLRRTRKLETKTLAILLCFFLFCGFLESPRGLNKKGNDLYTQKKYQSALEAYRKAQVKEPEDPVIRYNLATTLYQVDEYNQAAKDLETAIQQSKDPEVKSKAYYNYGNAQYRLGNFEKAIEAYKKSLEVNPKDVDSKYNLEFLQKEKNRFEKKDQERQQDQQSQEQPQPDQQQQQQDKPQNKEDQKQAESENENQQQPHQGGQGQDEKDKEQKGPEGETSKDEKEKQKQQDQQKQDQERKQQEKEQEEKKQQEKEKKDKEQQQQEQQQDQQQEEQNEKKQEQQEPKEQQGKAPKPLQGQMTMENAMRILEAMKESEKELQDLRRPPVEPQQSEHPPAKDW